MQLDVGGRGKYRHVVFAGGHGFPGRVVNLAPAPDAGSDAPDDRGAAAESPALSVEEEAFVRWLFERGGIDARAYRPETLRRRLPACLRAVRAASPVHARQVLLQQPALIHHALSAMVIGVTTFFRDGPVFDRITLNILPTLADGRPTRVWSVGCSEGEELYSVTILLAEMGLLGGCYLLGTDCRLDAINRAREGLYDAAALRNVPREWVERYFTPVGDKWQIDKRLRTAVHWRRGDVTRLQEPGAWDLILCRNMAMYLRTEASGRLWELFEGALRPGGFLVLGKAERPVGAKRLSPIAPCIYRRDRG